jgi:hypothetical protein
MIGHRPRCPDKLGWDVDYALKKQIAMRIAF